MQASNTLAYFAVFLKKMAIPRTHLSLMKARLCLCWTGMTPCGFWAGQWMFGKRISTRGLRIKKPLFGNRLSEEGCLIGVYASDTNNLLKLWEERLGLLQHRKSVFWMCK